MRSLTSAFAITFFLALVGLGVYFAWSTTNAPNRRPISQPPGNLPHATFGTSTAHVGSSGGQELTSRDEQAGYSEDALHVYYQGQIVPLADPKSFHAVPNQGGGPPFYFEDSAHVYALGSVISDDPADFRVLGEVAQPASWGDLYAADKTHVFFFDEVIPGADPNSFVVFPKELVCGKVPCEAKDANHYYENNHVAD